MEHADGHRYFEGLAVAHVLGGLDDSEGRVFRAHLLECGNCRARVGELRAIAHDLADVERDERRVRAAQAIETKRRETEEEVDITVEPMPSPRSSRITVVVGLILVIGLSLWNFTLRSALTVQEARNKNLEEMGTIAESGEAWTVVHSSSEVSVSVKSHEGRFLLAVNGLDPEQVYGLYTQTEGGQVVANYEFSPRTESLYEQFKLPDNVDRIILTNPADAEDGSPGRPGPEVDGVRVLEATRPLG